MRLSENRIEITNTVNWINTVNFNKYYIFGKVNKKNFNKKNVNIATNIRHGYFSRRIF